MLCWLKEFSEDLSGKNVQLPLVLVFVCPVAVGVVPNVYESVQTGKLKAFTETDGVYEVPTATDLNLNSGPESVEECAYRVRWFLYTTVDNFHRNLCRTALYVVPLTFPVKRNTPFNDHMQNHKYDRLK